MANDFRDLKNENRALLAIKKRKEEKEDQAARLIKDMAERMNLVS